MAKLVGVLNDDYFFNYQLKNTKAENFLSIKNNNVIQNDSAKKAMRFITDAFYETSK
jgi:hypothetical protein